MNPTVSIVIPCFNVVDTLPQQLDKLIPQIERVDAELILVDNNSTDGTSRLLLDISCRPGITISNASEFQSAAHARNIGVAAARTDRILFCDADDVVGDDWVAAMTTALDTADIVTGSLDVSTLNSPALSATRGDDGENASFYGLFPIAHGGNMAFSRQAWTDVGPFDETLVAVEDIEWSLRATIAGHEIMQEPLASVGYRYRTSPGELWRQGLRYGKNRPIVARMAFEALGRRPARWAGARSWAWFTWNIGRVRTTSGRAQLAWVAGNRLGNLVGSINARFMVL